MNRNFILDTRGAALPEYALLLFAVLLVGAGAVKKLGPVVSEGGSLSTRILEGETISMSTRSTAAPSSLGSSFTTDSLAGATASNDSPAAMSSAMAFGGGVVLGGTGAPISAGNTADSLSGSAKPSSGSTAATTATFTPHFTSALFTTPQTEAGESHASSAPKSKVAIAKSEPSKPQSSVSTGAYKISATGEAQMTSLLNEAKSQADGNPPEGRCYASVATYIDAVGYGKMGKAPGASLPSVPDAYGTYAHQFADYMNAKGTNGQTNASRLGLQKLPITNPYKAPPGSIVVVRAGTPGTANPVAGDIVVVGKNGAFYNDGNMGYGGSQNFPAGNTYVLGIYAPK